MSTYSIKDLEHLSGIKAHTLRIWEQRYKLVSPKRTDTNIRFYDDEDLKFILNVSLLKDHGYKISSIAKMTLDDMKNEVITITEKSNNYHDQIQALTLAMIDLDEERFEKILSINVLQLGFEKTMINIIYPFLVRVGYLWQTDSINTAQEHFISHLVRQKLIVAIDGQMTPKTEKAKKYLLFLPEGELHEIGLLFACYLIKTRGHKVYYFGQSLPHHDLQVAYQLHKPEYLLTIISSVPNQFEAENYLHTLLETFPDSKLLVSGLQVVGQDIRPHPKLTIINKVADLVHLIDEEE
ncbi:MAG: MerR family transcriptional regulator [Cytophagales bacterium]|nr:MAG: MerR family transcriptional regulator [Cytophagales bacterium]